MQRNGFTLHRAQRVRGPHDFGHEFDIGTKASFVVFKDVCDEARLFEAYEMSHGLAPLRRVLVRNGGGRFDNAAGDAFEMRDTLFRIEMVCAVRTDLCIRVDPSPGQRAITFGPLG